MAETNFKDAMASFDGAQAAFAQGRFSYALTGFRRAAEQGHPVAPWALGTMYALELGEARDNDLSTIGMIVARIGATATAMTSAGNARQKA